MAVSKIPKMIQRILLRMGIYFLAMLLSFNSHVHSTHVNCLYEKKKVPKEKSPTWPRKRFGYYER